MADLVVTVPSGTLTLPADVIVPLASIDPAPSAGAVSSVNGETGAVVLDAADVGAATAAQGAKADAALPAASLDTAATALDADPASALRVQQDARLSSTFVPKPAVAGSTADVLALDGSGNTVWSPASAPGAHASTHSQGGADAIDAANLGSGAATDGYVLTADGAGGAAWEAASGGGVTDHGALTGLSDDDHPQYAAKAANLSDLASAATARTNLGLGGAAVLAVGTTAGTVAAGDDSRMTDSRTPTTHASSHDIGGSDGLGGIYGPGFAVNTVAASGATETLPATYAAHSVTMDQNCTFTFPTVSGGFSFMLRLAGAYTPTFPASVKWSGGSAPTYTAPAVYTFTTFDGGTTWKGVQAGRAFA